MTFRARWRRRLQQFNPYLSLGVLLVPLLFVEPLKIVALYVAGEGNLPAGIAMLLSAYAVSIFFIERLFVMVKPKLMTLGWFARCWRLFATFREKAWKWVSGRDQPAHLEKT
jgi:hypothetical protein